MAIPNEYARYLSLGAEIAASLIIPIALGYAIDKYFEMSPIFFLVGAAVGLLLFFSLIARLSKDFGKEEDGKDV